MVYVCMYMVCVYMYMVYIVGLAWWLSGKESARQYREHVFNPWVRKIPWRRKWQHTPVFLPWKSHGQRSLAGYSPWGYKSQVQLKRLNHQIKNTLNLAASDNCP